MNAIETHELSKEYKDIKGNRLSLDKLNLHVGEKEVFGFLGRNGAGKTTTIKLLCGLLRPSGGEAKLFGTSIREREARRMVGYLPEQPYFYEYLTPRETIDFYGRLRGLNLEERKQDWKHLSELLDLGDIAERRIKGFSKGMRQRIGFAVALVGNPPLLILDEPMSGLDPVGRRNIRELILRCRDEGKTVFFSSHVLGDVEVICDRIGMLVQGKLTREGQLKELLARDASHYEVIAEGLVAEEAVRLGMLATEHRRIEELDRFVLLDANAANQVVKQIAEAGGRITQMMPIKTRLEDYFMQEQERQERIEDRVS